MSLEKFIPTGTRETNCLLGHIYLSKINEIIDKDALDRSGLRDHKTRTRPYRLLIRKDNKGGL